MTPYSVPYANMIRIVKVVSLDANDESYTCLTTDVNTTGDIVDCQSDRTVTCWPLNNAPLIVGRYYVAYQIVRGGYYIDNQSIFLELQAP